MPNAPGGQNAQGQDRQQKIADVQQKQIELIERQSQLVADELSQQGTALENLQSTTATLESRAKQAARRDLELANQDNALIEQLDAQRRNGPQLPAMLKGMFAPIQTTSSPLTIINNFAVRYDLFTHQRGARVFEFQEFTPFFLVQLNKRILLSGELTFAPSGVALGQAQADIFINDWLTMDIGYFLAPIGFWNERLDPEWINKLPDQPLVMRQVIPDGLTLTGLQFRGGKYLFGSPVKMEYSVYATDAMGVPGMGQASDWADLGQVIGTTANINQGMTYGGRLAFWLPTRGINFGVSELANAPYFHAAGAITSIWQPYFNYHRGNWDFRFEYGQNYERTRSFIGNSIERNGFYTRLSSLCSFRTLYFTPESGPATEGFSCRGAVMNDEGNAARKIRKLRASRDLWKQRSAEKQQEIRQLRVTVRDLSSSRENWKTRVKELEQQLQAAHEAHAAIGPGSWIFFGGLMDNQAMPRTRRTPITLSSD